MLTQWQYRRFDSFAAQIRAEQVSLDDVAEFQRVNPSWAAWWEADKSRERTEFRMKLNEQRPASGAPYRRSAI